MKPLFRQREKQLRIMICEIYVIFLKLHNKMYYWETRGQILRDQKCGERKQKKKEFQGQSASVNNVVSFIVPGKIVESDNSPSLSSVYT